MNDNELKKMIESILTDIVNEKQQTATTVTESSTPPKSEEQHLFEESVVSDGEIADITEVDLRKQLLVPDPHDKEGYLKMKSFTPARLGVWRAGNRYMTQTALRFRADHAAAQDAVFSDVNPELVKEMGFIDTQTICETKDEYLTRPDHGRQFSDEMKQKIKSSVGTKPKVQIVVGDGLSSAAIEANIKDIIPAIEQGLKVHGLHTEDIIFVKYCRVPAMDQIGDLTGAEVVCLLVGERPGLVTAESMSAYIAYKPTVGMPEANRTVISNIHKGGTPSVEAGAYIADLIKKMLDKKKSGIELKSE